MTDKLNENQETDRIPEIECKKIVRNFWGFPTGEVQIWVGNNLVSTYWENK